MRPPARGYPPELSSGSDGPLHSFDLIHRPPSLLEFFEFGGGSTDVLAMKSLGRRHRGRPKRTAAMNLPVADNFSQPLLQE